MVWCRVTRGNRELPVACTVVNVNGHHMRMQHSGSLRTAVQCITPSLRCSSCGGSLLLVGGRRSRHYHVGRTCVPQ